jgi:hypothetical protein
VERLIFATFSGRHEHEQGMVDSPANDLFRFGRAAPKRKAALGHFDTCCRRIRAVHSTPAIVGDRRPMGFRNGFSQLGSGDYNMAIPRGRVATKAFERGIGLPSVRPFRNTTMA